MSFIENDLLDREDFVDKMVTVTEIQAKNKKSTCYAIDGRWGIGKSYVLEMYKERVKSIHSGESSGNNYIIFEYNCWKYDYYEEPIFAIVSIMLDTLSEIEGELSDDIVKKVKGVLKSIGKSLLKNGDQKLKEYIGFSILETAQLIQEGIEKGNLEFLEDREFDEYINFKKKLKDLQDAIKLLTNENPVIFIVDELDRCLPEYAIKVLERLHHIFDEVSNMQVVLSIDKLQLEQTVRKIYGDKTDVNKYLAKFIDFDMKLEEGTFNDRFKEKFDYYLNSFDYLDEQTKMDGEIIEDFNSIIFEGIDIRNRIAIIEKCTLLHNIINQEDKVIDYSFMCLELFLCLLKYHDIDVIKDASSFSVEVMFRNKNPEIKPGGLKYIRDTLSKQRLDGKKYFFIENGNYYTRINDIWGVILTCYRHVIGCKQEILLDKFYEISEYYSYSLEFWKLLHIIN